MRNDLRCFRELYSSRTMCVYTDGKDGGRLSELRLTAPVFEAKYNAEEKLSLLPVLWAPGDCYNTASYNLCRVTWHPMTSH